LKMFGGCHGQANSGGEEGHAAGGGRLVMSFRSSWDTGAQELGPPTIPYPHITNGNLHGRGSLERSGGGRLEQCPS
jgi:hypothetical protein